MPLERIFVAVGGNVCVPEGEEQVTVPLLVATNMHAIFIFCLHGPVPAACLCYLQVLAAPTCLGLRGPFTHRRRSATRRGREGGHSTPWNGCKRYVPALFT